MVEANTGGMTGQTDIIAIWFLGVIGVILLALLILAFVVFRKRYLRNNLKFNIIKKDGKIEHQRIKNVQKLNSVFKKKYRFDIDCVVHRFWGREIYYFENNPEPINLMLLSKGIIPEMSSVELEAVIEEKVTEKLLGEKNIGTTEVIIIAVGVICLVTLFMVWGIKSDGVLISPESASMVKDWLRSVITGG